MRTGRVDDGAPLARHDAGPRQDKVARLELIGLFGRSWASRKTASASPVTTAH